MTTAMLTVKDEPFEAVRGEWQELALRAGEFVPFVAPVWQRVWLDHFQGTRTLRVYAARDGGRLAGILPALIDGDRAEFVGHYSICDYMDGIAERGSEREFWRLALERLAADGVRELELRGLLETSPSLEAIAEASASAGYTAEREDEAISPCVELPETWDEYLGRLSKKDRHEMRRKLRRLETAGGDVQFRAVTAADEADPLLETLFRLMRASNHHKEEFLDRPGMQEFFRAMTRAMADAGMLRLYVLTFDGQPVAMVHNLDVGGRLYMYNSGYDPQYSHYAVGLMSKALLIKDAIEIGRTAVDFMRGDESYKYDLGGQDRKVCRMVLRR